MSQENVEIVRHIYEEGIFDRDVDRDSQEPLVGCIRAGAIRAFEATP
jgi:hypothetical protein